MAELDLSKSHRVGRPRAAKSSALQVVLGYGREDAGRKRSASPKHQPLASPEMEIKIAAAQMACSRNVDDNSARIEQIISEAKQQAADVVVFPDLAVTGSQDEDIQNATPKQLASALSQLSKPPNNHGFMSSVACHGSMAIGCKTARSRLVPMASC